MTEILTNQSQILHSSWIELRADRFLSNLALLRKLSGHPSDVLAVIKANAYGHGVSETASILDGKVSFFGTATLREALQLKENHPQTAIFLFGHLFSHEIPAAIGANIVLSVSSFEKGKEISDCAVNLGRKAAVHVKIDTGMGRMGIKVDTASQEIMKMRGLKGLLLDGIYMHFPTAELNDQFRAEQMQKFESLLENLAQKGIVFRYRHAQNSAASLTLKSPLFNMIRPGLSLYGVYPDGALTEIAKLDPVLSFKSHITLVKRIHAHETVGYGRKFVAKKDTTVAVIPVGYSHGYPYVAWQKAQVLFKGKRYPLAGKVSMDYITVDLGETVAREGDIITLIGEDHGDSIRAEEIAEWAGTIPYEIVTRLNPHIPRIIV